MTLDNDLLSIRVSLLTNIEIFLREHMVNMDDLGKPDPVWLLALLNTLKPEPKLLLLRNIRRDGSRIHVDNEHVISASRFFGRSELSGDRRNQ